MKRTEVRSPESGKKNMILTVDIGNTHTGVGVYDNEDLIVSERISTDTEKTDTEYAMQLSFILSFNNINRDDIGGAIVSSVVPPINHDFANAIKKVTGKKPVIVGPGTKTGMKIKIDDPGSLGADLVAAAVGGIAFYGAPLIVIDLGTATTYSYIDGEGDFCGAAIMPGVVTSMESLVKNTALLPGVDFRPPKNVIMKDTIGSLQSGIIYGEAARIDGMIKMIRKEVGGDPPVIATGGLAKVILPYCESKVILDNDLVLKGLKEIYKKNAK